MLVCMQTQLVFLIWETELLLWIRHMVWWTRFPCRVRPRISLITRCKMETWPSISLTRSGTFDFSVYSSSLWQSETGTQQIFLHIPKRSIWRHDFIWSILICAPHFISGGSRTCDMPIPHVFLSVRVSAKAAVMEAACVQPGRCSFVFYNINQLYHCMLLNWLPHTLQGNDSQSH